MLQWIHDRFAKVAMLILAPLSIVFALWGIHGIVDFGARRDQALTVNGEEVKVERVRQAYQERLAELSRTYGEEIPAELRAGVQKSALDRFVNTALLDQQVV